MIPTVVELNIHEFQQLPKKETFILDNFYGLTTMLTGGLMIKSFFGNSLEGKLINN